MNFFWYLGAFAIALGVLIVVHEFGHYLVARWSGVKVLRFSVGFGKPLWVRRAGTDQTEWAVAAFPLGGYVKMLDEREGPVAAAELPRAFNRQPVAKRIAIVAAGPIANFLLAIFLYWALFIHGAEELRPLLAAPPAGTLAANAGIADGEIVRRVQGEAIVTWQDLRWRVLQTALDKQMLRIETENERGEISERRVDLSSVDTRDLEDDLLQRIGLNLYRPRIPAVVGSVAPGSVAAQAGLREGDVVVAADGKPVSSWSQFVALVRESPGKGMDLEWERSGQRLRQLVVPAAETENGKAIGRLGIGVMDTHNMRERLMTTVRYNPLMALGKATTQTWDTAVFSLAIFGRMITGDISWKNLSGPVTIADYAGQSARLGLSHYLRFLALISISLGVLNLLPIPVLDGGHLMYYLIEVIKGGPVSERVMEIGQQIGLALLVLLMAFAFYNDINRLISG